MRLQKVIRLCAVMSVLVITGILSSCASNHGQGLPTLVRQERYNLVCNFGAAEVAEYRSVKMVEQEGQWLLLEFPKGDPAGAVVRFWVHTRTVVCIAPLERE